MSSKSRPSILRASALMASGTMVSRLLGFVRSAMLLAAIGAASGGVSAAFQTANTLPNTVFNLLASGVFDAVLVPQIVGALKRKHDGETYVNRLLTLAGTLLFVVTLVAMVAAPLLVIITAAGYDSEIRNLAILFALLCLPQLFFYGLYNLLGELLNARGIFGPYMWAPVVNNVVGIAGLGAFLAIWGSTDGRIDVGDLSSPQFWLLAGSATLGVITQALILLIPMRRAGIRFRPDFRFRGTSFGSASKVAGWTFATLGVSQVGVLSTNNIAALADAYAKDNAGEMVIAGINAYSTAFMIFMVPQSLITVSLATAIFTRMAEAVADGNDRGVAHNYALGVRTITSLTLLAAAILMAASVPMMQMVLYSTANQQVVMAYALVLASLMPGVASTGMVLMSQRVFFAYEDVKPVFLMGIGPTVLQALVGWGMYFTTGASWWVVGAALGETACRLMQGVIAVAWVGKRVPLVDKSAMLRSYFKYLVSAIVAGLVGFGMLWLVGVTTPLSPAPVRFLVAVLKVVLVGLSSTMAYMLVLRALSSTESATTMRPLLRRVRVPEGVVNVLAASSATDPSVTGIMTRIKPVTREDLMAGAHDGGGSASSGPGPDGKRIPSFEEVVAPSFQGPVYPQAHPAPRSIDEDAYRSPLLPVSEDFPSPAPSPKSPITHQIPLVRRRKPKEDAALSPDHGAPVVPAPSDAPEPAPLPGQPQVAQPHDTGAADPDPTVAVPVVARAAAPDRLPSEAPAAPQEDPAVEDPSTQQTEVVPMDATLFESLEDYRAHEQAQQPVAPVAPQWPGQPGDGAGQKSAQHGRTMDPTRPTLIFAAVVFLVGAVWSTWMVLTPATDLDLAQSLRSGVAQNAPQDAPQSALATTPPPTSAPTAPPVISSVSVLSWDNDNGDHPDRAINMIDSNPATSWTSRWFDDNQFREGAEVTIVVKFQQVATVSSVTLTMDSQTSGGLISVRKVTDPSNPRGGTELATSALSPSTTITLPEPVSTDSIALVFRQMPKAQDGRNWAWVSELTVN